MRKSELIMHDGTESEIVSPERSRQADLADWQFDQICVNQRLDVDRREEEEEENEEDWEAAYVYSPNTSQFLASTKQTPKSL